VIEIHELRKTFRTRVGGGGLWRALVGGGEERTSVALEGLSLTVPSGSFVSLLGANGAGKTTSMKILCTLLLPDAGTASVCGFDVVRQPREVRERLGVSIRGERSVYWRLTGRQNLEYFARLAGLKGNDRARRIDDVVGLIGLSDRIDDYVERYSMGMKQRLAIGTALVHDPPLLLLDEPTIGLDPHGARALRAFVREELCLRRGSTVLYTTHYMHEAEELSDRVAVLHGGRIVAEGTPAEVRAGVVHETTVAMHVRGLRDADLAGVRAHSAVAGVAACVGEDDVTALRITPRGQLPVAQLVELATASGGELVGVEVVRPSLEDAFVALTGHSVGDKGEAVAVGG
jgi:ABC-2 type transport system ATP-binding protein